MKKPKSVLRFKVGKPHYLDLVKMGWATTNDPGPITTSVVTRVDIFNKIVYLSTAKKPKKFV